MRMTELNIGRAAFVCCNFFFMVSGLALVALGAMLLTDDSRVLMSRLLGPSQVPVYPLFYYVSLGFMGTGLTVCSTGVVGCWASCLHRHCILTVYVFVLVVLLLGECSVGVLAALCPQYIGVGVGVARLVDALQRNYGIPGRHQFTAAIDLAQTSLQCCGMDGASDYDMSWWRLRELGPRDLLVPRSCCLLMNVDDQRAFLDPRPVNLSACQSVDRTLYSTARHTESCVPKLEMWYNHHLTLLLAIGSALVLVELSVLLSAILVCIHLPKKSDIGPVDPFS